MGHREIRLVDRKTVVNEQVEVQDAGTPVDFAAFTAAGTLDRLQLLEEVARDQFGRQQRCGIDEIGLFYPPERGRPVQRGSGNERRVFDSLEHAERRLDLARRAVEVAAETDKNLHDGRGHDDCPAFGRRLRRRLRPFARALRWI